jgi:hypothetical protein
MKNTMGLKIVLYFFIRNKIENNKFKNKIKVGLTTGTSHSMKIFGTRGTSIYTGIIMAKCPYSDIFGGYRSLTLP